jgi:membrane protease YdiL (CAAX protease family)
MTDEPLTLIPLLCRAAVSVIIFLGTTLGLYSLFARQSRRQPILLLSLEHLRQRPFPEVIIIPLMAITLLFALMAAGQGDETAQHVSATALLKGAFLYALVLLLTLLGCMSYAKTGFKKAFGEGSVSGFSAVAKGLRYGVEIVPAILVVAIIVSTVGEALGFDLRGQEIFECLEDATVPFWARTTLVVFAVVVAPVVEELLFRGLLLPLVLKGRTFLFAALLTSLYFSLIHLHAPSLLPLLALSMGFSAGYAATGSILTPIAMHFVFNFTGLLLFFSEVK